MSDERIEPPGRSQFPMCETVATDCRGGSQVMELPTAQPTLPS